MEIRDLSVCLPEIYVESTWVEERESTRERMLDTATLEAFFPLKFWETIVATGELTGRVV